MLCMCRIQNACRTPALSGRKRRHQSAACCRSSRTRSSQFPRQPARDTLGGHPLHCQRGPALCGNEQSRTPQPAGARPRPLSRVSARHCNARMDAFDLTVEAAVEAGQVDTVLELLRSGGDLDRRFGDVSEGGLQLLLGASNALAASARPPGRLPETIGGASRQLGYRALAAPGFARALQDSGSGEGAGCCFDSSEVRRME